MLLLFLCKASCTSLAELEFVDSGLLKDAQDIATRPSQCH